MFRPKMDSTISPALVARLTIRCRSTGVLSAWLCPPSRDGFYLKVTYSVSAFAAALKPDPTSRGNGSRRELDAVVTSYVQDARGR